MQDATGGFSGCNFWQVAALEREKEAVLTCLGANRLFHDVLHLRGEDFYLQEVHGKTESGPILKGVAVFFQYHGCSCGQRWRSDVATCCNFTCWCFYQEVEFDDRSDFKRESRPDHDM